MLVEPKNHQGRHYQDSQKSKWRQAVTNLVASTELNTSIYIAGRDGILEMLALSDQFLLEPRGSVFGLGAPGGRLRTGRPRGGRAGAGFPTSADGCTLREAGTAKTTTQSKRKREEQEEAEEREGVHFSREHGTRVVLFCIPMRFR